MSSPVGSYFFGAMTTIPSDGTNADEAVPGDGTRLGLGQSKTSVPRAPEEDCPRTLLGGDQSGQPLVATHGPPQNVDPPEGVHTPRSTD